MTGHHFYPFFLWISNLCLNLYIRIQNWCSPPFWLPNSSQTSGFVDSDTFVSSVLSLLPVVPSTMDCGCSCSLSLTSFSKSLAFQVLGTTCWNLSISNWSCSISNNIRLWTSPTGFKIWPQSSLFYPVHHLLDRTRVHETLITWKAPSALFMPFLLPGALLSFTRTHSNQFSSAQLPSPLENFFDGPTQYTLSILRILTTLCSLLSSFVLWSFVSYFVLLYRSRLSTGRDY